MVKKLPVKEGWASVNPLTQEMVTVVPSAWADAHITALRELLSKINGAGFPIPLYLRGEIRLLLKETETRF